MGEPPKRIEDLPEFLLPAEAASILGASEAEVVDWCERRLLSHIRLAKRIRLIRSDDVVGVDDSEVSHLRSISTPPGRLLHEINEEALKHGSGAATNIYFARAGNAIKVGQSSDVPSRIAALQTASPQEIRVIGVISGRDGLEAAIHKRFSAIRIRGEWFKATKRLTDFISMVTEAAAARGGEKAR